jgi:integrase
MPPLYRHPRSPYWYVRIGRKTRLSTGTADRGKAEEFERVLAERLWRQKKLGDRGAISWSEVAERWLSDSARPRRRDRQFLDWLKPKIGDFSVSDVADPDAIERVRQLGLAAGWTQPTVDRLMNTVRAVLRRCVAWRYLDHAPHIPMFRKPAPEPRWITPEDLNRLCRNLPANLVAPVRFAALTGLRHSAQVGLTWDRIDFKRRAAWVPASQMKAGKVLGIALSRPALKLLRSLYGGDRSGHVFTWRGKRVRSFNTRAFRQGVKAAGLEPLRWHDLRHTFASWAVQSGVTLPELMQLGGWSTYQMALRYAHLAPQGLALAAEKVGALVTHRRTVRRRRDK